MGMFLLLSCKINSGNASMPMWSVLLVVKSIFSDGGDGQNAAFTIAQQTLSMALTNNHWIHVVYTIRKIISWCKGTWKFVLLCRNYCFHNAYIFTKIFEIALYYHYGTWHGGASATFIEYTDGEVDSHCQFSSINFFTFTVSNFSVITACISYRMLKLFIKL